MKKRHLLVSLMTIVLCLTLISGATFALFTSESQVNIAVTSGKVEVLATIENDAIKTYSLGKEQPSGTFENGGTAILDTNAKLKLNLLTPGDKAVFTVKIDNFSNVNIQYRVKLSFEGELSSGLVSKALFNNREYALTNGYTRWFTLPAEQDIPDVTIEVELPIEAGNEYQDKDALITVVVEAIQGNAETVDEWDGTVDTAWYLENKDATEYVLYTAEELAGFAAIVNGAQTARSTEETFAGKTIKLGNNVDLLGVEWTAIGDPMSDNYVGFAGTFDGQGYTISNLTIDKPTSWGQGLFGYNTNKTTVIKNFTINNVNINAEDTSGAVGGYFSYGTFENIKVTGDVTIKGAQHMGGIVGNGYYTNVLDCSVIAKEGSYITATTHSLVGGIIGYHGWGQYEITNCIVKNLSVTGFGGVGAIAGIAGAGNTIEGCVAENVTLTKTGIESLPSVGAAVGTWDANASNPITIANNTFKNITLNGKYTEVKEYEFNEVFGTPYDGGLINNSVVESNNVKENIVNNLEKNVPTIKVNSKEELKNVLAELNGVAVIDATGVIVSLSEELVVPAGTTIKGTKFVFNGSSSTFIRGEVTSYADTVILEDCVLEGGTIIFGQRSDVVHTNYVLNNCTLNGKVQFMVASRVSNENNNTVDFNKCTFGLFEDPFLMGYVTCAGGTHTFTTCNFNYTGGWTTGSNQYLKYSAINAYAENVSVNVILHGCTGSFGTQSFNNKGNIGSITVK